MIGRVSMIKKINKWFYVLFIMLTSLVNDVFSSPTINEFDRCKKLSVASLKYCIKVEPYNDNESCWVKSRAMYQKCYDDVFKGHSRDNTLEKMRKREAIKKHREMYKIQKLRDKI